MPQSLRRGEGSHRVGNIRIWAVVYGPFPLRVFFVGGEATLLVAKRNSRYTMVLIISNYAGMTRLDRVRSYTLAPK